MMYLKEI